MILFPALIGTISFLFVCQVNICREMKLLVECVFFADLRTVQMKIDYASAKHITGDRML